MHAMVARDLLRGVSVLSEHARSITTQCSPSSACGRGGDAALRLLTHRRIAGAGVMHMLACAGAVLASTPAPGALMLLPGSLALSLLRRPKERMHSWA
jgi:hypothetical protein